MCPHLSVQPSVWATSLLAVVVRCLFCVCVCVCVCVFFPQLCCPLRFQNSPQTHLREGFLLFGNFSFTTPSPGQVSVPNSFVSLFVFYILSYLLLKIMGCLSGCPPPMFRNCFVEVAQRANDLLMNLWERKWSPHPISLPY